MKICPITYEVIAETEQYSRRGLKLLSPQLKNLMPLQLTEGELRNEAFERAGKMSIQGVQPKLSAFLRVKKQYFEIVDSGGRYILKMQNAIYPELPENEALTMTLAKTIGLDVPVHGLVYSKDCSLTYFIKRFDRLPKNNKLAVEDFAQLLGLDRDTKYNSSMEKVVSVILKYCTYPKIELVKLFKLTLFNFLIGNEDMHLKNFSLITRDKIISLSPVYDLLNSTIAMSKPEEELALPLNGRKNNITKNNLFNYFAKDKLGLNEKVINNIIDDFQSQFKNWEKLITISFLSAKMKQKYLNLLGERRERLHV